MSKYETILSQLKDVAANPKKAMDDYKAETGKGAIGILPLYAPEELVHATGYLPMGIWGGQKRITMTGSLILNAKLLLIPVLGNAKTSILQRVINAEENSVLPAAYIINHAPEAMIFTDLQVSLE